MITSRSTGGRPSASNFGMSVEGVDAEATDAGRADREVALLRRFEFRRLLVVHHAAHQLDGVLRRQRGLRHRLDLAVDLDRGRKARGDEQVGAFLLDQEVEQFVDESGGAFAFHGAAPLDPKGAVPGLRSGAGAPVNP
jgi:hypothetical protein